MKLEVIKLHKGDVLISDETIREGDYDYNIEYKAVTFVDKERAQYVNLPTVKPFYRKVLASNNPEHRIKYIAEKLADDRYSENDGELFARAGFLEGWKMYEELYKLYK